MKYPSVLMNLLGNSERVIVRTGAGNGFRAAEGDRRGLLLHCHGIGRNIGDSAAGCLPRLAEQCGAVLVKFNTEKTPLTAWVD